MIYGRLNLIAKPSQIFNADETGIAIVHKPSKVVAHTGPHIFHLSLQQIRERCIQFLLAFWPVGRYYPPRAVPERMWRGTYPDTIFNASENGWINQVLFFDLFVQTIPPVRPVLLIFDGHGSHITIDVIKYSCSNDIHILCLLPSHAYCNHWTSVCIIQVLFLRGLFSVHV